MALQTTEQKQNSRPDCITPGSSDAAVTGSTKGLAAGGNDSLSLPPPKKLKQSKPFKAADVETLATHEHTDDVMALIDVLENTAESSTDHKAADTEFADSQDYF